MKSKEFQLQINEDEIITVKVIVLSDSLFIYIGDHNMAMNNAYLAIQTNYDTIPSVHKFLDEDSSDFPERDVEMMCKAIAKRLNKVITLSLNIPVEDPFKLKHIQELLIKQLSGVGDEQLIKAEK